MPDQDPDVKSDSSPEEELSEETLDRDLETEDEEETPEGTDVKTDSEASEESKEETESPDEVKAQLAKAEAERDNLKKALQEARQERRKVEPPLAAATPEPGSQIDSETYVKALVTEAEESAKAELYKEFPELSPDKDPQNVLYDEFAKDFAIAARVMKMTPVTKEQFLKIGRQVMSYKTGRTPEVEQAKTEARAEATREHLKADAANIGGTSTSSKPEPQIAVTDADRRAAKAAGMDLKSYLKNKDVYDDGIPI